MEFDQILFKHIHKFYRKITAHVDPEMERRTVLLEPLKPRLTLLSRALTGIQNEVLTSEREGGWSGNKFYLPPMIRFSENTSDNVNFYIFRTLYLSVQQQLGSNWPDTSDHKVSEAQQAALQHSGEILPLLFEEYPASESMHTSLRNILESYYKTQNKPVDYSWLYGRWMKMNPIEFVAKTTSPENDPDKKNNEAITTELEANPSDEVTTVAIDKKQVEDNVVTNNFEKVETLSEFNGNFKEMDGEDTLSDDEEAIRELNLKHTVRADDPTHSVYQAEFVNSRSEIRVEDAGEDGKYLHYDEWDYKKRRYKKDFCKVYPKFLVDKSSNYATETLRANAKTKTAMFKLFARVHNEYEKVNRVISGEEFDLDTVIDAFADIAVRKTPSDKIYTTRRKLKKDLSVLILMDTSLSADGYTNNVHILDTEKKAVLLFGEVLSHYNISFQIDTFSSRTRNKCTYNHIKTFNENWMKTRNRLGAIEAQGYTRIGTALRHAGNLIKKQATQRKWIILLSDGKPNDYDTYEGKYGIEDVKQALRELNQNHVHTFSLAIESQAKYYLPQMFGHKNYNILPNPSELPTAFGKFYKRIITS